MPDPEDLPEDELDDENLDGAGDSGDGEGDDTDLGQQGPSYEDLKAELDDLRGQHTRSQRELISAIGRLQAMEARVKNSGNAEDIATLRAGLKTANTLLDTLLEDEALDPKVKDRAARARAQADAESSKAELEALRRQVAELRTPPAPQSVAENAPTPFEEGIVTAITAAGLDPDDPAFDWTGEASRILNSQGQRATVTYFQKKIAELVEAKGAANRREARRSAGRSQAGAPAGGAVDPLDPSRPVSEGYEALKKMGAI